MQGKDKISLITHSSVMEKKDKLIVRFTKQKKENIFLKMFSFKNMINYLRICYLASFSLAGLLSFVAAGLASDLAAGCAAGLAEGCAEGLEAG